MTEPVALPVWIFGGIDPSGGAGITQDFRVLSVFGLLPRVFPTALTVQNIREVRRVHPVDPSLFRDMVHTVGEVESPAGLKIGLLPESLVEEVEGAIRHWCRGIPVVLDPVFRFGSGDRFHRPEEFRALARRLFPLSQIVTPNLPEAEILLERPIPEDKETLVEAAREIRDRYGPDAVYLKGGHAKGHRKLDVLIDDTARLVLDHPEVRLPGLHGGGCALASLILGFWISDPVQGVSRVAFKARESLQKALRWESERKGEHRRTLEGYFGCSLKIRDL